MAEQTLGAIAPNEGTILKRRGNYANPGGSPRPAADYSKRQRGDGKGKPMTAESTASFKSQSKLNAIMANNKINEVFGRPDDAGAVESQTGTSIFDPVLCELAYRWFSPDQGIVLDPFAGGSVRGIVAARLGRQYVGIELRAEQNEANREQLKVIDIGGAVPPAWVTGNSADMQSLLPADFAADFIFSCPPYADLEVYSDNPQDISTMQYFDFLSVYRDIIREACAKLKQDRFACFVVGEVRGKDGNYYNFVGDTVKAFIDAGLSYYNETILVTSVGSLPIRAARIMQASRKIGKTHQNMLVFVKGDGKTAAQACGPINFAEAAIAAADAPFGEELLPDDKPAEG